MRKILGVLLMGCGAVTFASCADLTKTNVQPMQESKLHPKDPGDALIPNDAKVFEMTVNADGKDSTLTLFLQTEKGKKGVQVCLAVDSKQFYQVQQIQGGMFNDLTDNVRNQETSFVETKDGLEITCEIEIPLVEEIIKVNGTATISSREIADALSSLIAKENNPSEITLTVRCRTNVMSITDSCKVKIVLKPIYNTKKANSD